MHFQERRFAETRIDLGAHFLEQKVPELADAFGIAASDPLAAFQEINSEVRAADEKRVREIVREDQRRAALRGRLRAVGNSQVTSRFAEHRTYFVRASRSPRRSTTATTWRPRPARR